jgi:prepilin signal peptidase PulO-like enzyme (type II secretory pathway)
MFGFASGSFLNAYLWRYENKVSLSGRSMCPKCKKVIAWYDNIPVISYLFLLGRCRGCHKPISIQYPLIELGTAGIFFLISVFSRPGVILSGWVNGLCDTPLLSIDKHIWLNIILLLILFVACSYLVLIAVYDFKTKEIPNGFNLGLVFFALIYAILISIDTSATFLNFLLYPLTALIAFLFFYAFVYFSKESWMGGGDAKLAIGMGLLLGPVNTFLAILISCWAGAIFGIILMVQKKAERKTEIPFGPFLAFGTLTALFFGSQLISWYARIILGM